MFGRRWCAAAMLIGHCWIAGACDREASTPSTPSTPSTTEAESIALAPGYGPLGFAAPTVGSYALPPLGDAADGPILTADGSVASLHDLLGEKITVLSLMYASCSDVNGCPLATAVLHQIASRMETDEALAQGLRLLSLSFDPERDTPDVMRRHASHHAGDDVDWQFLTTRGQRELRPILAGYGQALVPEFDAVGNEVGQFSHILRVFLIDRDKRIRNIYSVSYLHADTLVADVKTLLEESESRRVATSSDVSLRHTSLAGEVENRAERKQVTSHSIVLAARRGERVDLIGRVRTPQLGLPALESPPDNALTEAKVVLGRKLFYDRRLSQNGTLSCAMCHVPDQGFSNNEMATAVGIEGRSVRRNAPTILNVGYAKQLFHDGRDQRLEHQVWGPLLARNEMGNASVGSLIERIRGIRDYEALFENAFPGRGLEIETIGMAIASYERTLVAGDSAFDRWFFGKRASALGEDEVLGFRLFAGKAGCIGCHSMRTDSALFSDDLLHNTGIGFRASMFDDGQERSVRLAPGQVVSVSSELIARVSEPAAFDLGRYEITQDPDDRWKYKTPSLRNVALTAPYMHDGSLATLRNVVEFYDRGGVSNDLLDPRIRPLGLTDAEIDQLVAFLESLTGGDVDRLVADAFAAPVGDVIDPGDRLRPESR